MRFKLMEVMASDETDEKNGLQMELIKYNNEYGLEIRGLSVSQFEILSELSDYL